MTEISTLTIKLLGLRNTKGAVCIALFDGPKGYPNRSQEAIKSQCFPIRENPPLIIFSDLPYGCYAAAVFHDENTDSELNFNALGIPKEGIGFSGNPKLWKGVPSYKKVEFEFTPQNKSLDIQLKYWSI